MNAESKIDEKCRTCIPIEISKRLNIKSGEKILFQIKGEIIILLENLLQWKTLLKNLKHLVKN